MEGCNLAGHHLMGQRVESWPENIDKMEEPTCLERPLGYNRSRQLMHHMSRDDRNKTDRARRRTEL